MHVCLLARFHIIMRVETKSTCTVGRLFAFTTNHLLVRHNYFLHNLQLSADFDFSVLQRVKVANTGHRSLPQAQPGSENRIPGPDESRRGLSQQPGRGATKNKNSYQTLLWQTQTENVQIHDCASHFFRCKLKVWLGFRVLSRIKFRKYNFVPGQNSVKC